MASKFHIAVVSPFLDKRHGTERCVAEQVERLVREHGYEVHLYSQRVQDIRAVEEFGHGDGSLGREDGNEGTAEPPHPASASILWHKIPDVPGPHLVKYLWWLAANQLRRRRDLRARDLYYDLIYSPGINCWDADVIIVHIVFHEFYRLVRDELRFRKIPLRAWPRTLHRRLYYHLVMALEKRVYSDRRVTLVAVSGLTARELKHFFGRQDVHVIPNAVDLQTFNPAARRNRRAEARRRLRFDEGDFVLLLVGNDWKKKGLDYLLQAVSRCRELPLKVLVVGRDERAPYEAAIQRLGLRERVHFEAPSADVVQFYAAADAYVGPSLHDSFALPPAEAMACGLPVVTSLNNGGSEIISDGVDGLILEEPTDAEALARLIQELCNDDELRRRLGENAHQTAQKYSWARNAESLKAVFEQVVAQKKQNQARQGAGKMRVLVLAPPMENFGGIQRYTAALVQAMQQVLTDSDVRLLAIPEQRRSGTPGRLRPSVKWRFLWQALREAKRWRPDLVICAHVGLAPLGWLLRFSSRCRYWVIAHGMEVWGALPFSKRQALARADRLLVISHFTQQEVIKRYGIPAQRTFLLPPMLESRPSPKADLHAAAPVGNGRRIVLTVSRLAAAERYKGHDVMLRAWVRVREKVPEAIYLIVGEGDDRARLEGLARELGLGESVCFAGAVSEEVLAACYAACEVFAMPTRTVLDFRAPQGEGFGIVFLEAMAHGKPVIGPRFGAPSEFIRHGEHGLLVDPEDPHGVAQALIDLLTSPERAGRMGRAAQQWVTHDYSYDRFCERLRRVLNEST